MDCGLECKDVAIIPAIEQRVIAGIIAEFP